MRENIKKLVLSLLFVLCIFTSMPVLAEIVTFDNLPGSGEKQIPAGYSGFNWNNGWYLNATDNIYQNSGYQTALTSGSNVAFGANYDDVQISAANGADFTFNSAYFAAAWNNGLSLNLQGYNNGSLKYDMTYSLNTTEKKLIQPNFTDIDTLRISTSGGVNAGGNNGQGYHFAMDNFTYNTKPTPSPITVSPPPVPAFAPPMSYMPPPSSLVESVSTPQFIANNVASLPQNVASWINQVEIAIGSVQYPDSLKQNAIKAANAISAATGAIGYVSSVVQSSLLGIAESVLELKLNNANVTIALDSSTVAVDLITVAATNGNPLVAAIDANTFIWGDLVAPQLKQFGADPSDPNFKQFYQVPVTPLVFSLASTGNQALDSAMSSLIQSSYSAAQDLNGANHSFDRYTSAYTNGDTQSALLQLEAMLYYLNLYKHEAANNTSLLAKVRDDLDATSYSTPAFDPAWLSSMQQELLANGFPSELLPLFADFGFSNSDIADMQAIILGLSANNFFGLSIDEGLGHIEQAMSLTASSPSSTPEPATMLLLGLGLMGLAGVRRKLKK